MPTQYWCNGTAYVTGRTSLQIAVWGNDQLIETRPTLTLILKGPSVGGCTTELAGVAEVHVQVLGDNVQYVTGGPTDFANGLNVGPITFS